MRTIDRFILTEVEKTSHFIQRWTGWTCVRQHTCATVLWMCVLALSFIGYTWTPVLIGGLFAARIIYRLPGEEEQSRARVERGFMNLQKIFLPCIVLRVTMCVVALISFFPAFIGATSAVVILQCLSNYLYACDPLPPGRSKVSEWVQKLKCSVRVKPVAGEI